MIQRDNAPSTTEKPQTAVPPVKPPHKYLPFHPARKLRYIIIYYAVYIIIAMYIRMYIQ